MTQPSIAVAGGPRSKRACSGVDKLCGKRKAMAATTFALADSNRDIAPQHIVSSVGPTGCGKLASLSPLAGFKQPSARQARADGQVVKCTGPDRGVVIQQPRRWKHVRPPILCITHDVGEAVLIADRAVAKYRAANCS